MKRLIVSDGQHSMPEHHDQFWDSDVLLTSLVVLYEDLKNSQSPTFAHRIGVAVAIAGIATTHIHSWRAGHSASPLIGRAYEPMHAASIDHLALAILFLRLFFVIQCRA